MLHKKFLLALLSSVLLMGTAAAQTDTQLKQCNGADPALVILGCSLVGQALEDALNPRLRVAHLAARTFRLRPLVGRSAESL